MDSTPLLMTGLMLAALSVPTSAELKPLDDEALDQVVGRDGVFINVVTRLQAQELRYSQHDNTGEERGSVSIKNLDVFAVFPDSDPDARDPETGLFINRTAAALGIPTQQGVGALAGLLGNAQVLDPRDGERFNSDTLEIDVVDRSLGADVSTLKLTLPQLTRIRALAIEEGNSPDRGALTRSLLQAIVPVLRDIPVLIDFDLAINDLDVGQFRFRRIIDLDTELFLYGRTGGESGLTVDGLLGFGFGEISYLDTDEGGGQVSLSGVRVGQVDGRTAELNTENNVLGRNAFGAPFLGLTLDAETRELVDLTTGLSREASVLRLGLPDIQNLDLTVDNIRIGEGNLGGFEILDINTLVSNNRVLELNQRFGYNIAPGTGTGVDALGQAANGYQLNGELLLSGTADNSLQFNGQWGGQIGSIRYYDSLRGEEGQLALNDISVFNTAQDEQGNTLLTPAEFQGTLTLTPQGVEFGNLNAQGSIAIQSVTVGQSNLGAFLIDNFQLRNSHITISGK